MALAGIIQKLYGKQGLRSAGIYTFTNFFAKGISFLLIPVFTNPRFLTPADNGMIGLFNSSVVFLMPFISLGLVHSASTDFFKLDKKDFRDFFTTGFAISAITTTLAVIIIYALRHTLHDKYGFPVYFVWIIPLVTFLNFCQEQITGIIRNNQEPLRYLGLGVSKILLELSIALCLIIIFRLGWIGRVSGMITALTLIASYTFYYFIKKGYLFGTVRMDYIRTELVYALPIIAMQANMFIMNSSDKFFLANDHSTLGIYTIACTFSSTIIIFSSALIQYFFPKIFSLLSDSKVQYAKIRKLFYYYFAAMLGGFILFLAFAAVCYHIFINERYHEALDYIYYIATGYFLWSLASIFYSFLLYYKEKRKILLHSVLCASVTIGSNYYFIHRWSAYGAGIACMVSYFTVLLITIAVASKYVKNIFR